MVPITYEMLMNDVYLVNPHTERKLLRTAEGMKQVKFKDKHGRSLGKFVKDDPSNHMIWVESTEYTNSQEMYDDAKVKVNA